MLVLAIISLGVPLALNLRHRVDAEVRSQARGQADVVAATAADLMRPPRPAELDRLTRTAARSVRGRVIVVDSRGRLVADSAGSGRTAVSYRDRPEIAAALRGASVQQKRRSETLKKDLLATAAPVLFRGHAAGAVRVTQSVAAANRAVRRSVSGLVLLGAVVLLLGLLAGLFIAGQMSRPLRRLERTARRVSEGDLGARAPVEGSTEQRALARSFNEMTARVGRMLRVQRDFVADASHQLRTPLTGLRLRLEEARSGAGSNGARGDLDAGLRELDRLGGVLEDLLILSRTGERDARGERVDLARVVRLAAERWRAPAATRDIVVTHASQDAVSVTCSPADIERALDALVENAVRYSPPGGRIELLARDRSIEVLDCGPGLSPGEEEMVFERFHRGQAGRDGPPGSGLGLPIAAQLASLWDGSVELGNRPDGGARAVLSFEASVVEESRLGVRR